MKASRALSTVLLSCIALSVWAAPTSVEVPLNIPYALVRAQLAERIFIEPQETLHALSDASGCNKLKLAAPTVEGAAAGGMQVAMQVEARGGTPVPGGACLLPFSWTGTVILRESARASAPHPLPLHFVSSIRTCATQVVTRKPCPAWCGAGSNNLSIHASKPSLLNSHPYSAAAANC